jgi:hypothetical protein
MVKWQPVNRSRRVKHMRIAFWILAMFTLGFGGIIYMFLVLQQGRL